MAIDTTTSVTVDVRARPNGVWTLVEELFDAGTVLVISASNDQCWSYADAVSAQCGPDGDPHALLSREKCIFPDAPVGALIGKIGGSTAGDKVGTMFVAGSFCVFRVPDGGGPLFLTINDESGGLENNSGTLKVTVATADQPEPAPAPAAATRCIPVSLCVPAGSFDPPASLGRKKSDDEKSGDQKPGDDNSGDDNSGDVKSSDDKTGDDDSSDDTSGSA